MSFLVGFVLFKGTSSLETCLNLVGLTRQETIEQHFPMSRCSKIGHSYEAFTYLFGQNIFMEQPWLSG